MEFPTLKIVLIEDNFIQRSLIRDFLKIIEKDKCDLEIYTSSNGIEGLGYVFLARPDVLIIDSTLPEYNDVELLDFLNENLRQFENITFLSVIVLTESDKDLGLSSKYIVFNKKDENFLKNLKKLLEINIAQLTFKSNKVNRFNIIKSLSQKKKYSPVAYKYKLAQKTLKWSSISDSIIERYSRTNIFLKMFPGILWMIANQITNLYLFLFTAIKRNPNLKDQNTSQEKEDKFIFRMRVYPALATAASLLFVLFQVGFVFATGTIFFGNRNNALAATVTWDGGGTDGTCGGAVGDGNKWSCAANWSSDTLPTAADLVFFNSTSTKSSTIDTAFGGTITNLNLSTGYTGAVTMARSLNISNVYIQSSGTFNAANQILSVSSSFTISGGTFNANTGTLNFNGISSATLSCNNTVFNLVTFTHTGGPKVVSSNCSFPLGNNPTITNSVTLNGTLSGSGTLTTSAGTFGLNAGATLSGFTGLIANGAFQNNGATTNLNTYTIVDFNTSFSLTSGTFTAPSGNMTVASTFSITGGTFNANGGTITLDGAGSTITCNNATFNLVVFNNTVAKTVSSNCSLPLGTNPTLPAGVILNGTLSGNGTLLVNSIGALQLNAGAILSGFTGLVANGAFVNSGAIIDLSSYTTFVVNGTFTDSSGSITVPNGADFNGSFILNGGTFNAPSGTMTVASAFTITSGTFNANGGTVTFDAGSATLSCNNLIFNQVTFAHTGGTKTVNSNCSLPLGLNPTIPNNVILNGTLSGSGTLTTSAGTFTLNAGSALSGFSGLVSNGIFALSGGILNLGSYTTVDFNSTFNLNSGTFTAPSGIMTVAANMTIGSTTVFNANGGTVTFDGSTATLTCNPAIFNLVTFDITGVKTVASSCNLPLGANPIILGSSGGIVLNGTLSGTGILTLNGASGLTMNTGSVLSGFSGIVVTNLGISGATVDFGTYTTFDINGSFTLNSGTFTAPTGTMTIARNFRHNGGTFIANGGTVVLDDVLFDHLITGSTTFYNLTSITPTALSLIFSSGTTQTILGTLTLQGDIINPLKLRSDISGTQWNIDPQSIRDISYVDVQDSNNINATVINIADTGSIDSGNNTNWNFNNTPTVTNLGPINLTDGSFTNDNTPTLTFDLNDPDLSDTVRYQIQIDDSADFSSIVVDYTSDLAVQGPALFTVGQDPGTGIYGIGSLGQTLLDGDYYWRIKAIDQSGTESLYSTANSGAIAFKVLTTTPTGTILINNNDTYTATTSVTLQISADSASEMIISEDNTFADASWEAYSATKNWTLSSGDGTKTIYIVFRDPALNESIIYNDEIILDSTIATGSMLINNNDTYTTTTSVTLQISADSATEMIVSEDNTFTVASWEPYSTTKNWTLSTGDGTKTVYIKFRDAALNESTVYNDTIILDTTAPTFTVTKVDGQDYNNLITTYTTSNTSPIFEGAGENGDTITIQDGDTTLPESILVINSLWQIGQSTVFTYGNHSITLIETDPAGNTSSVQFNLLILPVPTATPLPPTPTPIFTPTPLPTIVIPTSTGLPLTPTPSLQPTLTPLPLTPTPMLPTATSAPTPTPLLPTSTPQPPTPTLYIPTSTPVLQQPDLEPWYPDYPVDTEDPEITPTNLNPSSTPTPTPQKEDNTSANVLAEIKIKILDEQKNPIKGAMVTINSNNQSGITNEDGIVIFKDVEYGDYKLQIIYDNYSKQHSLSIDGNKKDFEFVIQRQKSNLKYIIIAILTIFLLLFLLLWKRKRDKVKLDT